MFFTVAAPGKASATMEGTSYIVMLDPGWLLIHRSAALLMYPFRGPKTLMSIGCNLWVQWGGKDSSTIPFALQKSIASIDRWDGWLSSRRSSFDCLDTRVCLTKWARYKRKSGSFIQPVGLPVPPQPTGPPLRKWSLKRFRGKMKKGGTTSPWALPARATVTRVPLSAEVTEPTCFWPIWATTRSGTWTVVTPGNHTFVTF